MTKKLILILVSIWWGWTAIIDFAVVPTVFRVIHDFFNAGELGIAVFSKLNTLEVLISSLLVVLASYAVKHSGTGKLQLGLALCAWAIAMTYFSYLTPKLVHLTELWREADLKNLVSIAGVSDVQQEHQFYHRIYVGVDSVKLLILTTLMALNAKA